MMSVNDDKKKFALLIADAIQQVLRDSHELSGILSEAREEGYDILLSVESGIMIRRREVMQSEEPAHSDNHLPIAFEFTDADKKFLKSIGIRVAEAT